MTFVTNGQWKMLSLIGAFCAQSLRGDFELLKKCAVFGALVLYVFMYRVKKNKKLLRNY